MYITVGASSYNDFTYTKLWVDSVLSNIPLAMQDKIKIIVVDDGSPDLNIVSKLEYYCRVNNVTFINHGKNRGIPATWNTIARAFPETDMICIFNNDTRITSPDTFPAAVYFMDHNPTVGASSWPMVYVYPSLARGNWYDYSKLPAISRQVTGAAFWIRGDVYCKSRGFYEDMWSFWEEIDFSLEVYRLGYEIIIMPYPSFEHWYSKDGIGHYTFANNPDLLEEHDRKKRALGGEEAIWARRWEAKYTALTKRLIYPQMSFSRMVYWLDEGRQEKSCLVPKEMPCRYDPIDGVIKL